MAATHLAHPLNSDGNIGVCLTRSNRVTRNVDKVTCKNCLKKIGRNKGNICDNCGKMINWSYEINVFASNNNRGLKELRGLYCRSCALKFIKSGVCKVRCDKK